MNIVIGTAVSFETNKALKLNEFTEIKEPYLEYIGKSKKLRNINNIYLVQLGLGIANPAFSIGVLSKMIKIDKLIFVGLAGALKKELIIGDIILANNITQYDSLKSTDEGSILIRPGLSSLKQDNIKPYFTSDVKLSVEVKSILEGKFENIFHEDMGSGSEFVCNIDKKIKISNQHPQFYSIDMESSSVARACSNIKVPFSVVRVISDVYDPTEGIFNDFKKNLNISSDIVGSIIKEIVESEIDWHGNACGYE